MSREKLEQHFKDKLPADVKKYAESGRKQSGSNAGFIGSSSDDQEYMLKSAKTYPSDKKETIMKNDLLHEYMAYFERFMYDRSPTLGIATEDKKVETQYNFRVTQNLSKETPAENEILIGIVDFALHWKKEPNEKEKEIKIDNKAVSQELHTALITCCNQNKQLTKAQKDRLNETLNNVFDTSLYLRSKMLENFKPLNEHTHYKLSLTQDIDSATPKQNEIALGIKDSKLYLKKGPSGALEELLMVNNLKTGVPFKVYQGLKQCVEHQDWLPYDEHLSQFQVKNYLEQHLALKYGYINQDRLMKAEGFEKAIATCAYFGDMDFNGGNLGLINKDGKDYVAKIDHGRACSFFTTEALLRRKLCEHLKIFCYHNINLDVHKLKESVDEIIAISDEEIEALVKQKAFNLRKAGFVLDDKINCYLDGESRKLAPVDRTAKTLKEIEESRWKNLEENYIQLYKQQKTILKDLSNTLDEVIKLDMPKEWKQRRWIYDLGENTVKQWQDKRAKKENTIIESVEKITEPSPYSAKTDPLKTINR